MTKAQLSAALKLAQDNNFRCIDDNGKHLIDTSMFDGFGLAGFKPVHCTLHQLAALVRWQCRQMNGDINNAALEEIAYAGKKNFIVVGEGA